MVDNVTYSIIIPFYNAEKTLRRCLDSLSAQLREDLQILLVNDGAQDHSVEIALEYVNKYPCFQLLNQENTGVSRARNFGLEQARGTYITFLDSDDYVTDDYFAVLDQAQDCDLLVFAHENVGGAPLDETALFSELQQLDSCEDRLACLLASRKIMSPWNKRFRRDIIKEHQLRFLPDMHTGEDFNFCMAYAVQCKSIAVTTAKIIRVDVSDQGSLSRKYRPHLDQKLKIVFDQVAETILYSPLEAQQKNRLLAITDYLFVKHVFSCVSEEFKQRKLRFFRDRRQIAEICRCFQQPLSDRYCNGIHRILRLALKWRLYFLFYWVSYLVKGRKYRK